MPNVGDQHSVKLSNGNPFEETKPHVTEYTASEIATLSSRLEKQLGPEYISSRPGAGGAKVHYLSADKCINLANEVFGFNGWSSSIQQIQIDFVDENASTGKISLGLSVVIRVTLKDGTYHEDIGYGHIENCKGKAPAFEKAKKEGTTDALKRALRNFGNILGNCVYDKDYVAKVTKLKVAPTKFDPDNLHRHHDYAPVKREQGSPGPEQLPHKHGPAFSRLESHEDEFGSDDFEEVDFAVPEGEDPDGVILEAAAGSRQLPRRNDGASRPPPPPPRVPLKDGMTKPQASNRNTSNSSFNPALAGPPRNIPCESESISKQSYPPAFVPAGPQPRQPGQLPVPQLKDAPLVSNSSDSSATHEPPVGFFTARAAESLLAQDTPSAAVRAPAFNPHLESPSIRKTAGVDHTKTKPVNRDIVGAPPGPSPVTRTSNSGFTNPQADRARKVGMPGMASPLQNRGSYRPPQMKRPADSSGGGGGGRPALGDVTNSSANVAAEGMSDMKRPRIATENDRGGAGILNA